MVRRGAAAMAAAAREEEEASPAQRLVEAALRGDVAAVEACLADADADADVPAASCVGVARLRVRCAEVALREAAAGEVVVESRELKTDVSPLFAAAHAGHADVIRALLVAGADVNRKLFLGYATTAAAREGNIDILEMLLQAGATQEACEDALSEASLFGEAEAIRLLVSSEMIGPEAAAHALVTASSRGFDDVVVILLQNGVDVNCMARVLLRSVKPALHANVDCTPLVAAIMSRHISTVELLIEEGSYLDCLVQVGSWSWDPASGEELRVGACLGEHYNATWCAVEYYESSGEILKLLLDKAPWLLENPNKGRNLLCHAILCQNMNAVSLLLQAGANPKFPIMTKGRHVSHPIHLAARLGYAPVLKQLMEDGAAINAQTSTGDFYGLDIPIAFWSRLNLQQILHLSISEQQKRGNRLVTGIGYIQVVLGMTVLLVPWDPGGVEFFRRAFITVAWGQATFQGERNVTDRPSLERASVDWAVGQEASGGASPDYKGAATSTDGGIEDYSGNQSFPIAASLFFFLRFPLFPKSTLVSTTSQSNASS